MFTYLLRSNTPQTNDSKFKLMHSLPERQKRSTACKLKKPKHMPLIIENCGGVAALEKKMHAIPENFTFFGLKSYVLEQLKKKTSDSSLGASTLIMIVGNQGYMPASHEELKKIYDLYKDEDGFLYVSYTIEVAFG